MQADGARYLNVASQLTDEVSGHCLAVNRGRNTGTGTRTRTSTGTGTPAHGAAPTYLLFGNAPLAAASLRWPVADGCGVTNAKLGHAPPADGVHTAGFIGAGAAQAPDDSPLGQRTTGRSGRTCIGGRRGPSS